MYQSKPSTAKRRAAVYVRVSTIEQKTEGYGTEAQKEHILSYINNNQALGLTLEGTEAEWYFEDVHTGSEISRPVLDNLLDDTLKNNKFDVIIVWKIDRLSRDLKDLLNVFDRLQQQNIGLISIQENIDFSGPIGTLIFQMFGAIAQFERSLIQGRTRGGIIASATMGNYTGTHVPYGYRAVKNDSGRGKKLQIIEAEKDWVEKIFSWYIYEGMGGYTIAKKLNQLEVPRGQNETKKRAKKWSEDMVMTIIKNPLYRGEYIAVQKDEQGNLMPREDWVTVQVPPCVSELMFSIAQKKRTERGGQNKSKHVYPLGGLLKDMTTWKPFTFKGKPNTKNSGRSYNRAKIAHPETGEMFKNFSLPAHVVEDHIWNKILEAFANPDSFITKHLADAQQTNAYKQQVEKELQSTRQKLAEYTLKLRRIEDAYEEGAYDIPIMKKKKATHNDAMVQLDQERDRLETELETIALSDEQRRNLKETAKQFNGKLQNLTDRQKKIFMQFFIDRVEVRREEVPGAYKMRPVLTVFFRFLPEGMLKEPHAGRTRIADKEDLKQSSESENRDHGAEPGERYNRLLIRYTFKLEMQTEVVYVGQKHRVLHKAVAVAVTMAASSINA